MTKTHLQSLRSALLKLPPTGPHGFEGFIAAVLTEACGQPFRLASSGSQRGRDGDSAFDAGATYFEAKLYKGAVPKKEIAVKFMDLAADNQGQVDTFIIASTSSVPALNAADFRRTFGATGIGIVVLDWLDNVPLPPLPTVVTLGREAAKSFLRDHIVDPKDAKLLNAALHGMDHVAGHPEFGTRSATLLQEITRPSVGLGLEKAANHSWLRKVFSNRVLARQQLGQLLAPHDAKMDFLQPRINLEADLLPAFNGTPSEGIFAVIGPEGAGKSWLVANTWMRTSDACILLIVPAGELRDPEDITDFDGFLIGRIIAQTDNDSSEANRKRWRRRFRSWRENPHPANVRLTLCIDGLNQNSSFPWSRWIGAASFYLGELGGHLLVTTRRSHFPNIRQATIVPITRVIVPEWNQSELETILRTRNINPDVLDKEVYETLKNPRILSIAVELIDAHDIEKIEQLTVGRLLFEHLRTSELSGSSKLSPAEFAKTLSELADEYISRLDDGGNDDLTAFDTRVHARLQHVSSGLFFRPVGDDPDRYEIVEDGLRLALSIWLVHALERESRNGRDPFAQLDVVMEPLSGLDITAHIVSSAMEVACVKDPCEIEVAAALIRHYLSLQNLPDEAGTSFGGTVRKNPVAFLRAAKDAALSAGGNAPSNALAFAILESRNNEEVRTALERELSEWLSYYTLAPERMMYTSTRNDTNEKINAEREAVTAQIKSNVERLTEAELDYVETNLLKLEMGDVDRLHRLALILLAGLPLNQFVTSLFSFCISSSLTPTIHAPNRELEQLLRFNHVDWSTTQVALNEAIAYLGEERSAVGDWAVVKALRATGDVCDAEVAEELAEVLTKDRERLRGWRLVESYCATDPCDPEALRPDNIESTANKYRNMPVDKLCLTMGNSSETLFFDMAMPGVARFEPEAGAHAIRQLACHTLTREGVARRQAVHALLSCSVLMDGGIVEGLIDSAKSAKLVPADRRDTDDKWFTVLFSVFTAIPHLSGDEQLEALTEIEHSSLSLNFVDALRPASAAVVELLLKRAREAQDTQCLRRLVTAINHTRSPLTSKSAILVGDLLTESDSHIRTEAIGIASWSENTDLLKRFVQSGWDAGRLAPENDYFEIWYGSAALVAAVSQDILELDAALDRMALSHYGFAAHRLGNVAAQKISMRVELALGRVLDFTEQADLPEIEQEIAQSPSSLPPLITLREKTPSTDALATFHRLPETNEQLRNRQRHLRQAHARFSRDLTNADARLVATDLTVEGLASIVAAQPEVICAWHSLLIRASEAKRRSLHMFATHFSSAISETHADLAVSLFRTYASVEPLVRHVVGMAKIPVETEVIWSQSRIPQIAKECMARLDECTSDREISVEVLAAFKQNQQHLLASYVEEALATGEPVHIARALTVSGFSDMSEFAEDVLSRFKESRGFVGEAYQAAQDAYDRNRWARHWYGRLESSTTALEYWRYSVLLSKIVDGRFDLWGCSEMNKGSFYAFFPTIEGEVKRRIKKWDGKRKETLFGKKIPHAVFLIRDFSKD